MPRVFERKGLRSLARGLLVCGVLAGCGGGGGAAAPPAEVVGRPPDVGAAADAGLFPDAGAGALLRVQPVLYVDWPPPGQWLPEATELTIRGRSHPGTGALHAVTVAGDEVSLADDGSFSHTVVPRPGVNLLGLRLEDDEGGRAVDVRSFFSGDHAPPGTVLSGAAFAFLRDDYLDDDGEDDELDDVARVLEVLLTDPSFLAALDMPFESEALTLTPTGATIEDADVDLLPREGVLFVSIALTRPVLHFHAEGAPGNESLTGDGRVAADEARFSVDLALRLEGGVPTADALSAHAELTGFTIETDMLEDWMAEIPAVAGLVKGFVEKMIEEQVVDSVAALLTDLLAAMAFDFSFGEERPVDFHLGLEELRVDWDGIHLVFGAAASSAPGAGVHRSDVVGSLRTVSMRPPPDFGQAPVAFAVDDDLLNQIAFAFWHGGALSDMTMDAAQLAELGAPDLPDVFFPFARLWVDALLPLALTPRGPGEHDFPFDLTLGDLHAVLETEDGRRFGMFLGLRAGVRAFLDEAGEIKLLADRRPPHVDVHVGCYAAPPSVDRASVAALVRLMIPPILGRSNEGLPGFPVPGLPLSAMVDLEALADQELVVRDLSFRMLAPENHYLVLEGSPMVRTMAPRGRDGPPNER